MRYRCGIGANNVLALAEKISWSLDEALRDAYQEVTNVAMGAGRDHLARNNNVLLNSLFQVKFNLKFRNCT